MTLVKRYNSFTGEMKKKNRFGSLVTELSSASLLITAYVIRFSWFVAFESKFPCFKLIEIVYYTIPFGFSLF